MFSKNDATLSSSWCRQRDIALGAGQCMAWHLSGNPEGTPWLLLHGGPGSGAYPGLLAPLDLSRQWAVAPDQRGSGLSRPRGGVRRNHTPALVADLERLRQQLGLERWSLLAGSWGTVLALAYAQAHPQHVERLVLRGAFALTRREIGGLLQASAPGKTPGLPTAYWPASVACPLPALLSRLNKVLQTGTPAVAALRMARHWAQRESMAVSKGMRRAMLHAGPTAPSLRKVWAGQGRRARRVGGGFQRRGDRADRSDQALVRKFRVQAHYLLHRGFVRPGLLDRAVLALATAGVQVDWVHGRFDAVCPSRNSERAWALGQRVAPDRGSLRLTGAGHLGHEPGTLAVLQSLVRRT